MTIRQQFILLVSLTLVIPAFSQNEYVLGKYLSKMSISTQEDDPAARLEFMKLKYQNPKLGKIPEYIRENELRYYDNSLSVKNTKSRVTNNLSGWVNRGPFNVGGRTRALAIDVSNEDNILAGGVSGGMWRSTNGGQSWIKTTGSNELQSVTGIAQDTRNGQTNVWYYITGEYSGNSASGSGSFYIGDGVFKSTDGGESWSLLSSTSTEGPEQWNATFEINHEIVVDPTSGNVIVANYFGLYTSTDGGASWSQTYNNSNGAWSDVAIGPDGDAFAYLSTVGVVKSVDGGITWTDISSANFPSYASGDRGELAVSESNTDVIYLLAENSSHSSGHALWRYDDSSGTWEDRSGNIPQEGGLTGDFNSQGGYDLLIKVKPDDENFVIIGGTNLYRSTDGFASTSNTEWIGGYTPNNNSYALYSNHHPDQHSFVFYPSAPNQVISGNDGGLQYAADVRVTDSSTEPITWTPLNNGYLTTQVYAISIGPSDQILAGFQDNGTWETLTTSTTVDWHDPFSGDGAYSAYSSDGTMRYMSSQNANVYRIPYSDENDATPNNYIEITPSGYETDLFITPFYLDHENDDIFYLGGNADLWVNTSASGATTSSGWKRIDLPGVSGVVSEFGVVGNGTTYLGTTGGMVYKVQSVASGTPVVTNISPADASGNYISGIGVNEDNPDELLVVVSNYSVKSIFHTTDGGATWTHVGGNLEENTDGSGSGPSIRTTRILDNGSVYIVGTSVGLFTTTSINGSNTVWQQEDIDNLGAVVVEHVVSRNSDNLVVVGTHGNGVYSGKFSQNFTNDLEVVSIDSPSSGVLGEESIQVTIRNNGSASISAYSLSYSVNDEEQTSESLTNTISSGGTYTHTFVTAYDFSTPGTFIVDVVVSLSGDENTNNDQASLTIVSEEEIVPITTYPYLDSFESDDHGWTLNGIWEVGIPAQNSLSTASQGTQVLMTDLDSNYPDEAYTSAVSPVMDFTNLNEPEVAFDIKYDLEEAFDGVVFAYRTSPVSNFSILTAGLANWYTGVFDALGEEGWTGTGGYVRAKADLSELAGESYVQFSFFLIADAFVTKEGIAIDEFEVYDANTVGAIVLSQLIVPENEEVGYVVGDLSLSGGESAVYTLVPGSGDTNNELFNIVDNSLVTAVELNHEDVSQLSIRIQAVAASGTVVNTLAIEVTDENDAPTAISLTNSEIDEGLDVGELIGLLETEDEDTSDAHTFELVSGTGADDNERFAISGGNLVTAEIFDFESTSDYSVRVRVTDQGDEFVESSFIITISDVNEPPADISLSNTSIPFTQVSGYEVGEFGADDPEEDDVAFSLPEDETSDNSAFAISGKMLQTNGLTISSANDLFTISVEALDARGAFTSKLFELSVEQVLGLVNLAKAGISVYPIPAVDKLSLKLNNTYKGNLKLDIYSLEGQVVYRQQWDKKAAIETYHLDLSQLNAGFYVMKFEMGERLAEGKILIK